MASGMVLSCAEPLALPSRSPVCSSLSGPPRLSSALQPEAQKRHKIPAFQQSTTVKMPRLNSPEKGCGGPLHPRPNAPPHSVSHCFPGSQAAGESDGIPLDAINISFPFFQFLAASDRLSKPRSLPATIQMLSTDMQRGNPAFASPD